MAFLFKSKKQQQQQQQQPQHQPQQQPSAHPTPSRNVASPEGPPVPSSIPTANGTRTGNMPRNPPQVKTPTPVPSINNSASSLQAAETPASLELVRARDRSNSQLQNGRALTVVSPRDLSESPYPWSERHLNFTANASPFPRYGAAANAVASRDGSIYLMGGLINETTVKGDLWMAQYRTDSIDCQPIPTTSEGPGPRVGHASLLVGNAFIVFGGDTKTEENCPPDDTKVAEDTYLDETLYLLNTATRQWSRVLPPGRKPWGRYGHTLNIISATLYVFGGQVEGAFFNDLVAFDLNDLQRPHKQWLVLVPDSAHGGPPPGQSPPARTNHSVVTWGGKLYLFGGTDGVNWFSDVWCYDPEAASWQELDCIGYIPLAREGHAAAIVDDTMYVFGGRTREGNDLGDLAAFKIPSRRWYMFQNMGPSPSARSGHSMTAYGKNIVVLAGGPNSSSAGDEAALSLAYILDTSKIRYPRNDQAPASAPDRQSARKVSGTEKTALPQNRAARESLTRLPRPGAPAAGLSGPPPQQQPPQPRANGARPASKTPTKLPGVGALAGMPRAPALDRHGPSPPPKSPTSAREHKPPSIAQRALGDQGRDQSSAGVRQAVQARLSHSPKTSTDSLANGLPSRSSPRPRQPQSLDNIDQELPHQPGNYKHKSSASREIERPVDGRSSTAAESVKQANEEIIRELEAARSRNAWLASELALARKAGYQPNASNSPVLDERAAEAFGDDDKPLVEALIRMRAELAKVQSSIDAQVVDAANKIAQVEKQRDAAINEAVYAKTKLAAHGASQAGTPQPDGSRNLTPDTDRVNDLSRRLAASLAAQNELSSRVNGLLLEMEAEKRIRALAEETVDATQKRTAELDSYRQRTMIELESLRAGLHEAERAAREESASSAEAKASVPMLNTKIAELTNQLSNARVHSSVIESLRAAVKATYDRAALLESQLQRERSERAELEANHARLRTEYEDGQRELQNTARRLRDSEEIAAKHSEEAAMHREAVIDGLARVTDRGRADDGDATDKRVLVLQEQLDAASIVARKNREAVDFSSEKLRRAEERIAGLESYQEQASREALSVRKQLQNALREKQDSQSSIASLRHKFEKQALEANAYEVQLKTLKELLDERGISMSASEHRRSRALDSPSSRFSTPEHHRVRDLEQQLDASHEAQDEMQARLEGLEAEINKQWEDRLAALSSEHNATARAVDKAQGMLNQLELEHEARIAQLESDLGTARQEGVSAWEQVQTMRQHAAQQQDEVDRLQREKGDLERRIQEAEERVDMFLDHFEHSVDNYRRDSQSEGDGHGYRRSQNSTTGGSVYSRTSDLTERTVTPPESQDMDAAHSKPTALDNLATEIEGLRSQWQNTNNAFRLSQSSYLDHTPTAEHANLGEGVASWNNMSSASSSHTPQYSPPPVHQTTDSRSPTATISNGIQTPGSPVFPSPGSGPSATAMIR